MLTDRQSTIALRDSSLHVAFLAYGFLNARESIVNLKGVAVSPVCYNTSVPNECSFPLGSVTRISDLVWLTKLRYDRGELCNAELMMHLRDQHLPLRWCYFLMPLFKHVFGDVVSKRNMLCLVKRGRILCRLRKRDFLP